MTHTIAEIRGAQIAPVLRRSPSENRAVSCRHVTKEFGTGDNRALVLRGVDFDVRFGEMTLLVGPSGCGKTTLLSVIGGFLDGNGGGIFGSGRNMAALSGTGSVTVRRKDLGFVFQ